MNPNGARIVIYEVLKNRFRGCQRQSAVRTLHQGCRWAEEPLYVLAGRYLIWSDIPNDRAILVEGCRLPPCLLAKAG